MAKYTLPQIGERVREFFSSSLDNILSTGYEMMNHRGKKTLSQVRERLVEYFLDNPGVRVGEIMKSRGEIQSEYRHLFDLMKSAGLKLKDYEHQLKDASLTAYRTLTDRQPEESSAFY